MVVARVLKPQVIAAIGLLSVLVSTASADYLVRQWSNMYNFDVRFSHMPDFDQYRTGLGSCSGTPGGMYCVPTSAANLMAYTANHGFPYVSPGPGNWQLNANHPAATDLIAYLADFLNTDDCDGTSPFFNSVPLQMWLTHSFSGPPLVLHSRFVVTTELWMPWNVVGLSELAKASINSRAIQLFCYGRYHYYEYCDFFDKRIVSREGGHCVTFSGPSDFRVGKS